MIVDTFSPAKMKRWLLECYRFIEWSDLNDVGQAFKPLGLCLRQMQFREMDGVLELCFYVDRIGDYESFLHSLVTTVQRHGGRFVTHRLNIERPVREIRWAAHQAFYQHGPDSAELTVQVVPPGVRRGVYAEMLTAVHAMHARTFGRRDYPRLEVGRIQDNHWPVPDY